MLLLIMWALLVVPWISLFFVKKEAIRRYMPVAIFASLLVTLWNELAFTLDWWRFNVRIFPWLITNIPFVFGTFLAGTIWIFYFTFKKFWVYLATNIVIDALLAFPFNYLFERIGLYRLINYNSWNIFFTSVALSVVIYGYQVWQVGAFKMKKNEQGSVEDFKKSIGKRVRAR